MIGQEIHNFVKELAAESVSPVWLRQTLQEIKHIPSLKICSVPSGTAVFDWTVPKEWSVKKAYIVNPAARRFAIFQLIIFCCGIQHSLSSRLILEELQNIFIQSLNNLTKFHISLVILRGDGAYAKLITRD